MCLLYLWDAGSGDRPSARTARGQTFDILRVDAAHPDT
jgi:hypothetical protein